MIEVTNPLVIGIIENVQCGAAHAARVIAESRPLDDFMCADGAFGAGPLYAALLRYVEPPSDAIHGAALLGFMAEIACHLGDLEAEIRRRDAHAPDDDRIVNASGPVARSNEPEGTA